MNDDEFAPPMSEEAERQLDELLNQWASRVTLSPQQEECIFSNVFAAAGSLDYAWWRALYGRIPFQLVNRFNVFPKQDERFGKIS